MISATDRFRLTPCLIGLSIIITVAFSCSPASQTNGNKTTTYQPNDTLLVDKDGNRYSLKLFGSNILWMTTNLDLNIPGSYFYDNKVENGEQYGRLYTWESAQQGCSLLGEGWRLPTSAEWRQLSMAQWSNPKDSIAGRKEAFKALLHTGSSGFNAILGGGRNLDGKYARIDAHGFYWTITEIDSSYAWNYNFAKGSQALYQQDGGEKDRAFSVRCVKSIDSLKK